MVAQQGLDDHRQDHRKECVEPDESAGGEGKTTCDVETHGGNQNEAENAAGKEDVRAFEQLDGEESGRKNERVGKVDALWKWYPHGG